MRCTKCGRTTIGTPQKGPFGLYYVCGNCKNVMPFNPVKTVKGYNGISRCPRCGTAISVGWDIPRLDAPMTFNMHTNCPVCQQALSD